MEDSVETLNKIEILVPIVDSLNLEKDEEKEALYVLKNIREIVDNLLEQEHLNAYDGGYSEGYYDGSHNDVYENE